MKIEIKQIFAKPSEQYPYTHRVGFDGLRGDSWPVYKWHEEEGLEGVWAGGALYTTERVAVNIALRWSS